MLNLGKAETIVYDVTDSIFDRSKEGYLYIVRDNVYAEGYVISLPAIRFVYSIKENQKEADLQRLLHDEGRVPDRIIRENLVKVVREAIKEFR